MEVQCKPGYFSVTAAADQRREEFDCKNEVILSNGISVSCVFFGDSITQRWELNAYFSFADGCMLNRGICGDSTQYAVKRFYADVVQLHPKRCVSLIGINDAWDMEYDPWRKIQGMQLETVLTRAVKNHTEMLRMAREAGIRMYLCSLLPTDLPFTNADEKRRRYAVVLNAKLRQLCAEWQATYVDYYSSMQVPGTDRICKELVEEGLHPNAAGYNRMAQVLKQAFEAAE